MQTVHSLGQRLRDQIDQRSDPWYRFARVISTLEKHLPEPIEGKWLDVGCQIGQFLVLVEEKFGIIPAGIDDFHEGNLVEVCRRYLDLEIRDPTEILNDTWRYFTRHIDLTGFDIDEKFDYISALEVIEHMVDTDAFIQQCRSHLKDGGYFVVTTPNINSLRNRVQVPFGHYPASMEYRNVVHHVRIYNVKMLKSHVEQYGFRLIALEGVSFLPRRIVKNSFLETIDPFLCRVSASLCGNIIALFKAI